MQRQHKLLLFLCAHMFLLACFGILYADRAHLLEKGKKIFLSGTVDSTMITHENRFQERDTGQANAAENFFPKRSQDMLNQQLQTVQEIVRPVLEEITQIRKTLFAFNNTWQPPKRPSLVLSSSSRSFMRTLNTNSMDILHDLNQNITKEAKSQAKIRTIEIWGELKKLTDIFVPEFFLDYATNDCNHVERHSTYGHNMARSMFNASCHDDLQHAWLPKSFQYNHFRNGLPSDVSHTFNKSHIMLNYIHLIKNGTVDSNGDVACGRIKIVIRRCSMKQSRSIPRPRADHVYDEVFTISQFWGGGFFHATVEDLTRIGPYVDFLRKNKQIKVHVKKATGFMKAFMEYLGIKSSRLVSGDVGAKLLYVPAGTTCGRPSTFPTYMLSLQFRSLIATAAEERKSVVIIKRSFKRKFRKHKDIVRMLRSTVKEKPELGLKVEVYPDNPVPKLKETLAMFNRAFLVVAPHGAGESNLMFSEPGTAMIEGLCGKKAIFCYRNLALALGHRYYGMYGPNSCNDATPEVIEEPFKQIINMFFNNSTAQKHNERL